MPRSDEAASFFYAVYAAVREIPPGRVTTYGHIAALIGTPQRPRQVGICLKHLPPEPSASPDPSDPSTTAASGSGSSAAAAAPPPPPRFHAGNVPWQRVISAKGIISPRSNPAGSRNQAAALRAEGVEVGAGALGELTVDLDVYGWFPRRLPSEAAEAGDDEDDEDEDEDGEEEEEG